MKSPTLRLYELVFQNGRSSSPYVWRIRYALAHKGLLFDSVPLGFTEIPAAFGGRLNTVPVLGHGDTMVGDSWDIAEYLDRAFARTPALFSSPAELATVRLTEEWFAAVTMRKLPLLAANDEPLRSWLDRSFDLYGGIGRDPRMKPLFE